MNESVNWIEFGTIILIVVAIIFLRIYATYLKKNLIKANEQISYNANLLQTLLNNVPDFIYFKDLDGKFVKTSKYMNLKNFEGQEDLIGKINSEIFESEYAKIVDEEEKNVVEMGKPSINKIELEVAKNGRESWVSATRVPIFDNQGDVTGTIGIVRDITKLKQTEDRIKFQEHHDDLTGLPNRSMFYKKLNIEIGKSYSYKQEIAIMFIDLDRFKYINDTAGHEIGDELIKLAGVRLKEVIKEPNVIARFGGDEFTVLIPNISKTADIIFYANSILKVFSKPFTIENNEYFITTSIGISIYPFDGTDAPSLFKNADIALYRAKEEGGNTYQLFNVDMNLKVFQRLSLENNLRHAVERNEFVVYYQPQVDMNSKIVGMEALVRWKHPDMGIVSPISFIPLAEETGLIIPISEWVIREACRQTKEWLEKGYDVGKVAVNLSSRQFKKRDLFDNIIRILEEIELEPKYLEIEITESIAMQNEKYTIDMLQKFREYGFTIAIDDFGTGYSSLAYLKKFPVNTLKVDQSFVRNMINDINDAAIVNAVINLAHNLNLDVTVEGVETKEHIDFLRVQECEKMQGYYFSRPVPAEEYELLLKHKVSPKK